MLTCSGVKSSWLATFGNSLFWIALRESVVGTCAFASPVPLPTPLPAGVCAPFPACAGCAGVVGLCVDVVGLFGFVFMFLIFEVSNLFINYI